MWDCPAKPIISRLLSSHYDQRNTFAESFLRIGARGAILFSMLKSRWAFINMIKFLFQIILSVFCAFIISTTPKSAIAGKLTKSKIGGCDYEFSGPVANGDASQLEPIAYNYDPVVLCFNSKGGNLRAGLQLFEAIWDGNINTKVMEGSECSSACAIAFLAGGDTQGTDVTRQVARAIEPGARLRFHSPRLLTAGLREVAKTDSFRIPAYEAAIQTSAELFALSQRTEKGVGTISNYVLWKILGTPYSNWYQVETVADAVLAGIDLIIPLTLSVKNGSQIINICDNFHASNPWKNLASGLHGSAKEQYASSAGLKLRDGPSSWPRFIRKENDGTIVLHGASYESGSKYGWVNCIVHIDPPVTEDSINHYGDPIFTSHRDTRIKAGLFFSSSEEIQQDDGDIMEEVPIWFALSPELKISDIDVAK